MTLIEFEYEIAQQRSDKRMILEIKSSVMRTVR